jgi:putative oxidoreductase
MTSATLTNDTSPARGTGKAANVALWVLQVGAAAMLGMAGFAKLFGEPAMIGLFEAIGIGQWFRYVTGGLEVLGAVLLLVPALAGVGALLLACVMLGAIATHLFVIGGTPAMPLVLLVAVGIIAYARRERTLRLLGR